ncbi:Protein of unknown function (DUF1645 [Striga hermonthica]|uniref:Uncharacterized protein n=1 Tax=Striga hermonthica TaxID=68872 RepID=A0A9N7RKU8_STRHE|nr:Protein of unknown function (DUF1645 [Striga hermonthica]
MNLKNIISALIFSLALARSVKVSRLQPRSRSPTPVFTIESQPCSHSSEFSTPISSLSALDLGGVVFPVFDRDLLPASAGDEIGLESEANLPESSSAVAPLSKLFAEESEDRASCSSSEVDELESVPEGTYCVWRPRAVDRPPPGGCRKSSSTGSASKRWRFRDLLRSNSEGKESFVFLAAPKTREEKPSATAAAELPGKAKGKGAGAAARSAQEALYVQKRAVVEGNKKKSYLPYRRDLVGFFVNVDGLGKRFPRFCPLCQSLKTSTPQPLGHSRFHYRVSTSLSLIGVLDPELTSFSVCHPPGSLAARQSIPTASSI